ncbi:MAG: ABC transporter ATPase [Sphingobacterium sp.]
MKKVWIYQANRFFTEPELTEAKAYLDAFVRTWTAHGSALAGKAEIHHNLFVVLTVDESVANATGCSVDRSVHVLKELEQQINIGLFDRTLVAYVDAEGATQLVSRDVFEELVKQGEVTQETQVFNNLVKTEDEWETSWLVPFKASWHARVFKAAP